jgi:hypothetical protein
LCFFFEKNGPGEEDRKSTPLSRSVTPADSAAAEIEMWELFDARQLSARSFAKFGQFPLNSLYNDEL